jgi:5-methylcytosine-specific restriction endonuclease McrA
MASIERLAQRDGRKCRYCGRKRALTIEHLTPLCRGGSRSRDNLGISCKQCNFLKGPLTEAEFLRLRGNRPQLDSARARMSALISRRAVVDVEIRALSKLLLQT